MDGAEVGIFEERDEERFRSFLEREDRRTLEANLGFELLSYIAHQPLERQFANEQVCGFLVLPDLAESHGAWPVSLGVLDGGVPEHVESKVCTICL